MTDIHWWHRIRMPDGSYTPGMVNHGPDGGDWPTTRFGMPKDMTGMRVLDIGAWDGFFSFEAERRGAELVVASDVHGETSFTNGGNWGGTKGFLYAREALKSKVQWEQMDITNPDHSESMWKKYGKFDLIMCFGVLYHIPSDLGVLVALYRLKGLAKKTILIETASNDDRSTRPRLDFNPGRDCDPTNFYYPNPAYIRRHILPKSSQIVYDLGNRFTMELDI